MNDATPLRAFAATVDVSGSTCPACASADSRVFYEVGGVPTHQVRLVRSRAAALACPKGDIRLTFCHDCGFVWNAAFDPALVQYEEDYESTQAVSPTFNRFHERLTRDLVGRYDLAGKEVFEIGCGQGEFLALLCDLGVARAVGFDPVLRATVAHPRVTFHKDWYSEAYGGLRPDFIGSKMVMEHIPDPGRFLAMLRRALGERPEVIAFAMMPEVTRILERRAFWDVYYEHCAYFSLGALGRAFRTAGFRVRDLWTDYGDQYALIGASPDATPGVPLPNEESPADLARKVDAFARRVASDRAAWSRWLGAELAVDVNPARHGTYIAGTGQQIVGPADLAEYQPDVVLIMSPIYRDEIAAALAAANLRPRLASVEDPPWELR